MTTFLEEIAAGLLDSAMWGFAEVPECPACESRLRMLNGNPTRSAACVVNHAETGEVLHSALVDGHNVFWTTLEAEISEVWLRILPTCAYCHAPYRKADSGCGEYCSARCQLADKHSPADDYVVEVAA